MYKTTEMTHFYHYFAPLESIDIISQDKKSQNHFFVEGHIKLPSNEQSYFENNKILLKKEWIQHNFWWSFELSITFIRFETATNVHWHLVYLEDIAQGKNEPFGKRFDMHFEHNTVKIERDNAQYNGIEGTNIDTNSISLQ